MRSKYTHIMLQAATFKFLKQLGVNNNKTWFDAHRNAYEIAKADMEQVVEKLIVQLVAVEPALEGQKAKDCIYRIFRDVRFSKDKTPYKAHFSALFSKGGRKYEGAMYYLHLEPGKCFMGGGMWMPQPPLLKKVRQEIDYNFKEFKTIVEGRTFIKMFGKINGEQLKKLPQGYEADNPAMEYLKMKSFTVGSAITDEEVMSNAFVGKCMSICKGMKPFIDFLNRSIE